MPDEKPDWSAELRTRLAALQLKPEREADIVEELSQHLDDRWRELVAGGASPAEAKRTIEAELANRERLRDYLSPLRQSKQRQRMAPGSSTGSVFGDLWRDIRYAARMLRANRGFTAVTVLTLALGIGATTALFSVVYGVVVSPYPYARAAEIWAPGVRTPSANAPMGPYRLSEYREIAELPAFADTMATSPDQMLLTGGFAAEMLQTVRISGNAAGFLGVAPVLGRAISPSDIRASGEAEPVAVLSFGAWQRLFGGRPDALGQTLRLNDEPHTVIGVMPPRFGWWTNQGVWLPLGTNPATRNVFPITRLAPGITTAAAAQQLHALHQQFAAANPNRFPPDFTSSLTNYLDITVASGEMERSLQLLFGAVALLLLIACANVASLQLARGSSRVRELAVRLSLGAARNRVVRQLLTESVLLSGLGGVVGLGFAFAITRLMVALMPEFYVPNEARIEVNGLVLLFCAGTAVLTGIVFGLVPALQSSRPNLTDALKDSASGSGVTAGSKTRAALVVTEVVLSVVLLVSAGMTARAFVALQHVDLGFRPEQVMTARLLLPPNRYDTAEKRNRFAAELLTRAADLPGVVSAAIGNGGLPFGGPAESTYAIGGAAASNQERIVLQFASAGYLSTLGIALHGGRSFTETKVTGANAVALVNESAARLWPAGETPIGRTLRLDDLGRINPNAPSEVTVIGVFADARNDGLRNGTRPAALLPFTFISPPNRTLALRAPLEPQYLMNALRAQVRELDPEVPIGGPGMLADAIEEQSVQPRFTMSLFALFAALGLALAAAGIYSVLSYLVVRRTREIGMRMALGAGRRQVLRMFMTHGARLVGTGLIVGIVVSLGVARLLTSRVDLFQVPAFDAISIAAMVAILAGVAAAACYLPARRATRVDPMAALRRD
jgi:putative ABC transport system permease protein